MDKPFVDTIERLRYPELLAYGMEGAEKAAQVVGELVRRQRNAGIRRGARRTHGQPPRSDVQPRTRA